MKKIYNNISLEANLDSMINKGILETLPDHLCKYLYDKYIDAVKTKLTTILVPKNFYGDAEHYLYQKGVEYTPEEVEAYSLAFYTDFMNSVEQQISYNESTNEIQISEALWKFQDGDLYKPDLHIFSDELKELAKLAEKAMESIRK